MNLDRTLRVACALFGTAALTAAQFPGDFYFSDPTPLVFEGESTTLEVVVFTGTDAFGAASFDLHYDPVELGIDAVGPAPDGGLGTTVHTVALADRHGAAVYNDASLAGPFGTISLVEVEVTPLVPAGGAVQLTIVPRELLEPNGAPFAQTGGLSALITVAGAAALVSDDSTGPGEWQKGPLAPWIDPLLGDVPLRRPGYAVDLWSAPFTGAPHSPWRRERRRTFDPGAPSDL